MLGALFAGERVCDDERDARAVGRELRVAQVAKFEESFRCKGFFSRLRLGFSCAARAEEASAAMMSDTDTCLCMRFSPEEAIGTEPFGLYAPLVADVNCWREDWRRRGAFADL